MKKGIILLLSILYMALYSGNASAQSYCVATIATTDSINSAGYNFYTFTALDSFYASCIFSWSFGDGTAAQGQVVTHSFTGGANTGYVVSLTVADTAHGCTIVVYDTIVPSGYTSPCSAYFNSTNVDSLYTLSVVSTGVAPFTYNWDLPNGTFSTLPDPTYTIGSTGIYSGFVVVTDSTGCIDTVNYTLSYANTAGNGCQAYFYVLPDSTAGSYTAVDCSTGSGLSYLWSFGDGGTSTSPYPTHTYTTPGYYTVCLTVSSANGCSSSFCDSSFYANKVGGGPMSALTVTSRSAATGIPGIPADAISIYPNPASSSLMVKLGSNDKIQESTIYNAQGQKVAVYGSSAALSVGQLSPGIYLIEVRSGNGSYRSTFVKKD